MCSLRRRCNVAPVGRVHLFYLGRAVSTARQICFDTVGVLEYLVCTVAVYAYMIGTSVVDSYLECDNIIESKITGDTLISEKMLSTSVSPMTCS